MDIRPNAGFQCVAFLLLFSSEYSRGDVAMMDHKWMIGTCVAATVITGCMSPQPLSIRVINQSSKAVKAKCMWEDQHGHDEPLQIASAPHSSFWVQSSADLPRDSADINGRLMVTVQMDGTHRPKTLSISGSDVRSLYKKSGSTPAAAGVAIDVRVNKYGAVELNSPYLKKPIPVP
jgi:hypothetical protein